MQCPQIITEDMNHIPRVALQRILTVPISVTDFSNIKRITSETYQQFDTPPDRTIFDSPRDFLCPCFKKMFCIFSKFFRSTLFEL